MIPNGPETEQGARHALSLRRHIAGRSPALDDLCAVLVDALGGLNATITIADRTTQYVVGGYNVSVDAYPRTHARYDKLGDFFELTRMDESPAMSGHPMVDGRGARSRSALITGIFHQGVIIGGVSVGSDLPEGAFSDHHRAVIFRVARIAESVIRSEVALSRMASEALSVLTEQR